MLNFSVKAKFKSIDVDETSKKPNADRRVKHIFCIFISIFFLLHRTKEPVTLPQNHVVEHRITRTDIEDKKVGLEETAVAHVNPL